MALKSDFEGHIILLSNCSVMWQAGYGIGVLLIDAFEFEVNEKKKIEIW